MLDTSEAWARVRVITRIFSTMYLLYDPQRGNFCLS